MIDAMDRLDRASSGAGRFLWVVTATCSILVGAPASLLGQGIEVRGRVETSERAALGGAVVELHRSLSHYDIASAAIEDRAPEPLRSTRSDADGRYVLRVPEPGMWSLVFRAPGRLPQLVSLEPLFDSVELRPVWLPPVSEIAVTVRGPDGAPVPGALVMLWVSPGGRRFDPARERSRPMTGYAHTDETGVARLDAPVDGEWDLIAATLGLVPATLHGERGEAAVVTLAAGQPRTVRVLGAGGDPAQGALVLVGDHRFPWGRTGEDGAIALQAPREAPLSVRADVGGPGLGLAHLDPAAGVPAEQAVELKLATVSLAGVVVSARDRAPVAGAWVWDAASPRELVETDAEGRYRIEATPRVDGSAWLRAAAPSAFPESASSDPALAAQGEGPTIALRLGGRLNGVVVDTDGRPVPDAELRWSRSVRGGRFPFDRRPVHTGPDGRFVIAPIEPGAPQSLLVRAQGFAPKRVEVAAVEAGAKRQVRVELDAGRIALGTVVDLSDRPVAGAEVALTESLAGGAGFEAVLEQRRTGDDDALPATTDAKGRFAIADLAPGRYDLEARASGFATARVPGVSVREDVPSTEIGSIALSPGVAIEGVVRDADGVPLEGVEIHMQDEGGVLGILRAGTLAERSADTTSNADGRFRLEDLADGAIVTVRAKLEGYSTTGVEGVRAPTDEPLELRMERAATLRGVVVDHLGEGVESAEVRLTPESRSARIDLGDITSIVRNEHADREGRFAIANVVSGRYELRASASGFQETRQTGIEVTAERDPAELRLVLERGAALHGQVLGDDGNPVLGASVQRVVQRRSPLDFWAGPNDATSGADGRYRLEGLPTGQSTFSAEHERFPKQVRDFVVQPGENLLDFRLEAGRTISGRVVDDTGLPIAGASVSVRAPTGGIAFSAGGQADPLTDEGGQFTIEGLADGVYHVVAHKAGFADATTEVPMRLDGSSVHGIELQLSTGAALVGKVLGLDFDELANVQLIAMQMGGLQMGSAANPRLGVVDYEGRYRLENLAVGDWILVATVGQGRRSVREMVTVEPGAEEVVRDLDFGGGQAIRGRVVRNGEPVRGVAIFAVGTSTGNGSHGATDQDGRFALLNLESDTYRLVVASLAGVPSHEEEVELAGADAEVLIELREAAIAGRVVDASDRAPVAGAAITVVAVDEDSLVRGFGGFGGLGTPPHSTADGSFRIGGFSPGTWLVRAEKEGYAAGTAQIEIGESADALAVEIELEPASGLTLIVTSPFGRPVNEVFVAALDAGERSVLHGQYSAGEGGVVRLDELPAGSWTLLVTSGGSATASIAVESPGAAVPVRLPEAGILQVRVTELEGTGLQASARLLDAAGRAYRSALFFQTMTKWPLFDGVGTIPQVPAGTWTLEVSTPDGERTWSRVVSVLPGTTLDVIID